MNTITITADELFYLGRLMNAKYIDYAYITDVKDTSGEDKVTERTSKQELVKKELIFESFSGKTQIDETVEKLLSPLFFGEREASFNLCFLKEDAELLNIKYHFSEECITKVILNRSSYVISETNFEKIDLDIAGLFSDDNGFEEGRELENVDKKIISDLISVKNVIVNGDFHITIMIKSNGIWYIDKGDNHFESITKAEMLEKICKIIKE